MSTTRPTPPIKNPTPRRPGPPAGFTLVEVITAVAIAMVLLLGVNQVFRMTGDTVAAGQATSGISRDVRAAQSTMLRDFRHSVTNPPVFMVINHMDSSPGGPAGALYNSPNDKPLDLYVNPAGRNARDVRHCRVDRLSFFASGDTYQRLTADPPQFVSKTTSAEAYITYAPVRQYGLTGNVTDYPGNGQDYNLYTQDFILGRVAMLMVDPRNIGAGMITDKTYFERKTGRFESNRTKAFKSDTAPYSSSNTSLIFQTAECDLAAVTIDQFRNDVFFSRDKDLPDQKNWWRALCNDGDGRPALFDCKPLINGTVDTATLTMKAMDSQALARTTPYFVGHVSNFLVEFAGDFLTQDDADLPAKRSLKPDGKTDYIYDPVDGQKKVRWYGLTRSTHKPSDATKGQSPPADVMPLHTVLGMATNQAYFERGEPADPTKYYCLWVNEAPSMVRVTMKIEDPSNALQEGRWFEFVLSR